MEYLNGKEFKKSNIDKWPAIYLLYAKYGVIPEAPQVESRHDYLMRWACQLTTELTHKTMQILASYITLGELAHF